MNIKHNFIDIDNEIKKYPLPNPESGRSSVEDYLSNLVAAGNRVKFLLNVTSSLVPARKIDKLPQGIVLGHITRLTKLYDSYLLLVSENQSEASMLIARAIVETSINLKYLVENITDDLCDKFVKSSLSYDKKLWDFLSVKIGSREPEEFEKRLQATIKNSFSNSKYKLEDIDFSRDRKWSSDLLSLSKIVGLVDAYETMYRILSRAEHGAWQHLEFYNLKENTDYYSPELSAYRPDPQIILGTNTMCLISVVAYLDFIQVVDCKFKKYLHEVSRWFQNISNEYFKFKDENANDINE